MARKNDITAAIELAFSKKFSKTGGTITGPVEFADTVTFVKQAVFSEDIEIAGAFTVNGAVEFKKLPTFGKSGIVASINNLTPDDNGNINLTTVPVGTIVTMASKSVPSGFLKCDGSAVSRSTYAALYAVIGTTYGGGDGSSTFNLPNTLNRFLMSMNTDTVGTKRAAGLPNITGVFPNGNERNNFTPTGAFYKTSQTNSTAWENTTYPNAIGFDASRSNRIYGASSTVQPPSIDVLMCIKY